MIAQIHPYKKSKKMHSSFRKKRCFSLFFLAFLLLYSTNINCSTIETETRKKNMQLSFSTLLSFYGFSTKEKKHALEDIMQQANILLENTTAYSTFFSKKKTKKEILTDIITFVQETQEKFTIRFADRTNTKERWEIAAPQWMNKNKKNTLKNLTTLGLVKSIYPKNKKPDVICILGSTAKSMAIRASYLAFLLENGVKTGSIILLTGERYVTKNVDGSENDLIKLAKKLNKNSYKELTEEDLMRQIYKTYSFYKKFPTYILNTPAGNLPRATTKTTIKTLITWLKKHKKVKTILFISNQPSTAYQAQVINTAFQENNYTTIYEVVGPGVEQKNIMSLVGALGSLIWAKTPDIIRKLELHPNQQQKEELKKLFAGYTF